MALVRFLPTDRMRAPAKTKAQRDAVFSSTVLKGIESEFPLCCVVRFALWDAYHPGEPRENWGVSLVADPDQGRVLCTECVEKTPEKELPDGLVV